MSACNIARLSRWNGLGTRFEERAMRAKGNIGKSKSKWRHRKEQVNRAKENNNTDKSKRKERREKQEKLTKDENPNVLVFTGQNPSSAGKFISSRCFFDYSKPTKKPSLATQSLTHSYTLSPHPHSPRTHTKPTNAPDDKQQHSPQNTHSTNTTPPYPVRPSDRVWRGRTRCRTFRGCR